MHGVTTKINTVLITCQVIISVFGIPDFTRM